MVSMGILFFNQDEAKSRSSLTRQPLTLGLSSSRRPLDHALYGFTYSFRTGLGPLGAGDSFFISGDFAPACIAMRNAVVLLRAPVPAKRCGQGFA